MTDRQQAPRIAFMLGGVQKGGTTALARLVSEHPALRLPRQKEAHVFDADTFDDDASPEAIDSIFAGKYEGGFDTDPAALYGDATPISVFHPTFVERIARYNAAMRWIVILRDPATRAISHWSMERGRGDEHLSLPMALLAERWRLRGHEHDFSNESPLRRHSYLARGRYVRQLDVLFSAFPREQILLLRNQDLKTVPQATLDAVFAFLGVARVEPASPFADVFAGDWRGNPTARLVRPWLDVLFAREIRELQRRYGILIKE